MENYINRMIETDIISMSKSFPVIMVTGPRQVGKSTLLDYITKKINKEIKRISLDDMEIRHLALSDPKLFLETYRPPIIIDDFQYAPNLLSYIKINVDNQRSNSLLKGMPSANGMYYLTGSQSFLSMKNVSESLAGRVCIIELFGLSARELQKKSKKLFIPEINELMKEKPIETLSMKELYKRIFRGSFPEIHKNKNVDLDKYFSSYIKTYIERDIREMINIKDELKFMKFIVSIAARTAQELSITEIANDAEISDTTANEWLSILVNTGLVVLLEPFSKNIIKRAIKRPKLYFMDTGLASYLTKHLSPEVLEVSYYSGAIFETYVVSEIVKSFTNNGLEPKRYLSYYRDSNKKEIDLIIEYNNKIYPIEIKKSKNPGKDAVKNFSAIENSKYEIAKGVIICMKDEIFPIDANNYCIPISYI